MSRSLKLCLLVPGKSGTVPSAQCVKDVRSELRSLRDRINCLLDTLSDASPVASPAVSSAPAADETPEVAAPAAPKEFDPLQDNNVPASSFSDNGTQILITVFLIKVFYLINILCVF